MGFFGQIFKGEHRGFVIFAVVVVLIALLLLTFGKGSNIIHWVGARVEIFRQEKLIEKYNREIDQMNQKIEMLTTNRDSLEKFARENFLFAEPGEDVYVVEEER